jgi:Beta-galactosidase/Glycosyl hydrolase family 53
MRRRRGLCLLLISAAAIFGALVAAPAQAAKRQVPFGFFGTVFASSQANGLSDAELEAQMARMASSGVETVRYSIPWYAVEPEAGTYDFGWVDRLIAAAARHRMEVLPTVVGSPRWASSRADRDDFQLYAPRDPQSYANFVRVLIGRYGPRGSFWATSGTPKVPIRAWQIWNEPGADFFWATQPWPRAYVRLLKPAYRAVHAADRGATVLVGGLVGVNSGTPWGQLKAIYAAGGKGYFDAIGAHYYSVADTVKGTAEQARELISRLRKQSKRYRDGRKPIWFTELTFTAAQGRIPRSELLGFETTPRGQAARLKSVFGDLAANRKELGVGRVFWYDWASDYSSTLSEGAFGKVSFNFSGLNRMAGTAITPMPVLSTYASTVARFEGCRKTANARRCR